MKKHTVIDQLTSTTGKLALSYLAIIMVMSIGFSLVFYNASSHELGRQFPPQGFVISGTAALTEPQQGVNMGSVSTVEPGQFFQQRINEGRTALFHKLIFLNILALVLGSFLSYYLARRTLMPIEEAMDAQNRFISDASHELKTPLTAIQASNEVALRNKSLNLPQAKNVIESNIEETGKLKDLSNGLLSLVSQNGKKLQLRPVSMQSIATDAMNQIIHPAQAKDITVHDSVPKGNVMGNQASLTQVVVILLDNAIKYSEPKSNIYLSGSVEDNNALITVRDEGHGINASDLPHIFDRFYRVDRARSKDTNDGYGLGLAIADKIIQQHDGEIIVRSTPSKGSVFTIKLKAATESK